MTDYRALLERLSTPRLVGTAHHTQTRDLLKRELAARGFVVMEQRFPARPRLPLWGRRLAEGVNLIAVRPRARIAVWLAAHYDSKGQPISMATRLVLAAACVVAACAATATVVAGGPWLALAPPAALAALLVALNRVTDGSPGAVDNATAVIAVAAVLDGLPEDAQVGVLYLDAEEYGLLGAAALARARSNLLRDTAVINLDGIDDRGATTAFVHRAGSTVDAVVRSLGARRARWLPVVVDGLALARAARECVTIMRGDWETARVVHTPRDTAQRLTLEGVRQVAAGLAAALRGRVDADVGGV